MLDAELFIDSIEYAAIVISIGFAVGAALSATILWAETYRQLLLRFVRALVISALIISLPIWYLVAATFVNALISGVT